jgi:hypothetical protein
MRGWAAVLVLGLCGCATTVQVPARFPANDPDAAALRRVAVAAFDGPEGDHFAYALEDMLANADFDGRRYFTLVGSGARDVRPDQTLSFGRAVGADGVYSGLMQAADFDNYPWEDREKRCVEKDDNGKCIRKEVFVRPCMRRTFHMEVFPSLTNIRSGQVVYSARKTAGAETSWCRGDVQPISDDQMIDGAIANIIGQIRPDIAPYNTVLKATVIEKKDGLSEADAKLFDAAVKSAGKGDLSTACHTWDGLLVANPSHPWTIYNIGVCAEANGDFAGALAHYEKARSLAPKPDSDVAESIERANRLIAAREELRRTVKKKK